MRRHKREFRGQLAQPLYRWPRFRGIVYHTNADGMSAPVLSALKMLKEIEAAGIDRLQLLLAAYDIPPDRDEKWRDLALALASDYVPGFRKEMPPGARRKWGPLELRSLRAAVCELTATGMSALEACRRLMVAPDIGQRFPACKSHLTLYRRYQEAQKGAK